MKKGERSVNQIENKGEGIHPPEIWDYVTVENIVLEDVLAF